MSRSFLVDSLLGNMARKDRSPDKLDSSKPEHQPVGFSGFPAIPSTLGKSMMPAGSGVHGSLPFVHLHQPGVPYCTLCITHPSATGPTPTSPLLRATLPPPMGFSNPAILQDHRNYVTMATGVTNTQTGGLVVTTKTGGVEQQSAKELHSQSIGE